MIPERPLLKKPKLHFDLEPQAGTVTFDDGVLCRGFSWHHCAETNWDRNEPDVIRVEIGNWIAVLTGHNLEPLYEAIMARRLYRIRAQPELADEPEREADTFATKILFLKLPSATRAGQTELDLGL